MNKIIRVAGIVLGGLLAAAPAVLAGEGESSWEAESIIARVKAGASYYSHLDFNTQNAAFGFGVDVGFNAESGFGITAAARILEEGRAVLLNSNSSIDSRYFGIAPSYSVRKSNAKISAGLGLGIVTSTIQNTTAANVITTTSSSRMAVAPALDFDVALGGGATVNLGLQYLISLGSGPSPWVFLPMAGIGWNF